MSPVSAVAMNEHAAGPDPPERTKMSAPDAVVIVCVLKVDGSEGCAETQRKRGRAPSARVVAARVSAVRNVMRPCTATEGRPTLTD